MKSSTFRKFLLLTLFVTLLFYSPIVHYFHTGIYLRVMLYIILFFLFLVSGVITKRRIITLNKFDLFLFGFCFFTVLLSVYHFLTGKINNSEFLGTIQVFIIPLFTIYFIFKSSLIEDRRLIRWLVNIVIIVGIIQATDIFFEVFLIKILGIKAVAVVPWALDSVQQGSFASIVDIMSFSSKQTDQFAYLPTLFGFPHPRHYAHVLLISFILCLVYKTEALYTKYIKGYLLVALLLLFIKSPIVLVFIFLLFYKVGSKKQFFRSITTFAILLMMLFYFSDIPQRIIQVISFYSRNEVEFSYLFNPIKPTLAFFAKNPISWLFGVGFQDQRDWSSPLATEIRVLSQMLFRYGVIWFIFIIVLLKKMISIMTLKIKQSPIINRKLYEALKYAFIFSLLNSLHYASVINTLVIHYTLLFIAYGSSVYHNRICRIEQSRLLSDHR